MRYRAGERFMWHEDAVPPAVQHADGGRAGGQRLATLLVYLNDVPAGGATAFRDLVAPAAGARGGGATEQLRVKPTRGQGLLFFPAHADAGARPDPRTTHAGEPTRDGGEKWVAQIWVHERAYTPVAFGEGENPHVDVDADAE